VDPVRNDFPLTQGEYIWQPPPKFQDRRWLHLALLLATIASTTFAGILPYASFAAGFGSGDRLPDLTHLILGGLWYSATIIGILGAHELGHYFACRYYDVDASLPFFIPMPFVLTGTLGAVIRIREPIPSKRMLFDIGIAGPIAGFVVAVPCLIAGLLMSNMVVIPAGTRGDVFGEPLVFKALMWLVWGTPHDGQTLNAHPMVFGAWFGFLATSLNLFPIGQLDGGHISYAVLGRRSSTVTLISIGVAIGLSAFVSATWIVWTGLLVVMLFAFGRHHPRTFDEQIPLDPRRMALAVCALIMLIICFIPAPITLDQILR
jgi:membrane-associated protease RseP (regulator of RpoE activity)